MITFLARYWWIWIIAGIILFHVGITHLFLSNSIASENARRQLETCQTIKNTLWHGTYQMINSVDEANQRVRFVKGAGR